VAGKGLAEPIANGLNAVSTTYSKSVRIRRTI